MNLYNCSCNCIVFIVCSVSFIVCVVLCVVFCLRVVCYFVWCVICVLCLIVVALPPGKNPFTAKVNNSNNNNTTTNNNKIVTVRVCYMTFVHDLGEARRVLEEEQSLGEGKSLGYSLENTWRRNSNRNTNMGNKGNTYSCFIFVTNLFRTETEMCRQVSLPNPRLRTRSDIIRSKFIMNLARSSSNLTDRHR
jgi:hypothetical protein